jgi:hypothetical protein
MVQLGATTRHKTTKLGRYGIGLKDLALVAGGADSTFQAKTTVGSLFSQLEIKWSEFASRGWILPRIDPVKTESVMSGTTVTIIPLLRKFPEGKDLTDLMDQIGYLFSAAIKAGKQITVQIDRDPPIIVQRWKMPPLKQSEPMVDQEIEVGGQKARVYCGIVEDGAPNRRCGLTYLYGFRVIIPAGSSGCGNYSPARICGFVELDDSWPLTKNKDSIIAAEALFAAVEQVCLPVLKRAEEIGELICSAAFDHDVTCLLRGSMDVKDNQKAHRPGSGDIRGTAVPTGKGEEHKRARKTQPGGKLPRHDASSFSVTHGHLGNGTIGQVKYPYIILNLDNPFIAQARKEDNKTAAVLAAATLIGVQCCLVPNSQMKLKFSVGEQPEDISRAVGEILSGTIIAETE